MHINDLLKIASEKGSSDLHLKVGSHPVVRINGLLQPLTETRRLLQEDTIAMAFTIMDAKQKEKFKQNLDIDISFRSWKIPCQHFSAERNRRNSCPFNSYWD